MNTRTHIATIGSVSHGTLRDSDLICALGDELRKFDADHARVKEADAIQALWSAGWNDIYDCAHYADARSELVNDLCDALNEHAPAYCYFGTNEGDGSDFGFWPSMDAIDELPKFNDLADVPDDIEGDYAIVNDHGNVSIYGQDGVRIWDCV